MSDPEIDEVRASRREISAQCGHDIHAVLDYYRGIRLNPGAKEETAFPGKGSGKGVRSRFYTNRRKQGKPEQTPV